MAAASRRSRTRGSRHTVHRRTRHWTPVSSGTATSPPRTPTSLDPIHWRNPQQFDPDRYRTVPTSSQIDEAKCQQIGFARCPFQSLVSVADGRKADLVNSGFGTVFGVVDGKPLPVVDYAGFAPFGFGYRRCPGSNSRSRCSRIFCARCGRKDRIRQARHPQSGTGSDRTECRHR